MTADELTDSGPDGGIYGGVDGGKKGQTDGQRGGYVPTGRKTDGGMDRQMVTGNGWADSRTDGGIYG